MHNEELLIRTEDIIKEAGLEYHSDFSEAANQDTFTKWDEVEGVETIVSFVYSEETAEFTGVQVGCYSADQEKIFDKFSPITNLGDLTHFMNSIN